MSVVRRASFVVRVVENGPGEISGVIERVATGEKEAFSDVKLIGQVLQRMLRRERGAAEMTVSGEEPGPECPEMQSRLEPRQLEGR